MQTPGLSAHGATQPDEPRPRWWRLLAVGLQFALLVLVLHRFELESGAVLRLSVLAVAGFVVHSVLPREWRLAFFALLSVTGVALILGPVNGAWLVGLGLALIGICHLPLSWTARIALLLASGAVLALLRSGRIEAPFSGAIWPILGSMFMFRLVAYVYDLRHEKVKPDFWRSLSYFFLLPNVCFPLFPVVGYKTFRRTYYDGEETAIYQNGVRWILRGVVHLLLYRLVYHHLSLTPLEVDNSGDLARFVLSNYALYLRISGQFHFIVGLLQLFGFNLPETHHRFYLASSFSDFWRRINIYWKDFMMRVFYYPMLFRLQRHGAKLALVVATVMVFVLTWLLHSYQWFWLLGTFPVTVQDMAFWGLLGVLVVANSLWEMRSSGGRKPKESSEGSLMPRVWRGMRTAGFFVAMAALWSLWTSESVAEWTDMWRAGVRGGWGGAWWLVVLLVVVGVLGALEARGGKLGNLKHPPFWRSATLGAAAALVLLALTVPALTSRLGGSAATVVANLGQAELNEADGDLLRRGYYEQLTRVERFNSRLWERYSVAEEQELGSAAEPFIRADDFLEWHIVPSVRSTFAGQPFTTNRWRMRDRDYGLSKAPGSYRIALVGASTVMGAGVADDEVFDVLLEERLNRESGGGSYNGYEVLNFGIRGHGPLRLAMGVEERVVSFAPDLVLYFGQTTEWTMLHWNLVDRLALGIDPPLERIRETVAAAGVTPDMSRTQISKALRLPARDLVPWSYERIVSACERRGSRPWYVFLPELKKERSDRVQELTRMANEAGFDGISSLESVYDSVRAKDLWITPSNPHPNAEGHRLIADALYGALVEAQASGLLDLGLGAASDGGR